MKAMDGTVAPRGVYIVAMQSPGRLHLTGRARSLALSVYRATSGFPVSERYGLSSQMRRAAVSIGSNIYEGCGRSGDKQFVYFLHIALGSISELEFQSLIATDLGLIPSDAGTDLFEEINHTKRMLLRLITVVRTRRSGP